jgi:hypothetical protein
MAMADRTGVYMVAVVLAGLAGTTIWFAGKRSGEITAQAHATTPAPATDAPTVPTPVPPRFTPDQVCARAKQLELPLESWNCTRDLAAFRTYSDAEYRDLAECVMQSESFAEATVLCFRREVSLHTFQGRGRKKTRPFAMPGGWEFRWKAKGLVFMARLDSKDGDMVDVLANQDGGGDGASYVAQGGEFTLDINAMGSWTVELVALPPTDATQRSEPTTVPRKLSLARRFCRAEAVLGKDAGWFCLLPFLGGLNDDEDTLDVFEETVRCFESAKTRAESKRCSG